MIRFPFIFAALLFAIPNIAWADGAEPSIPVDGRMKVLIYDESDVYTIVTKYGYQTNIVFDGSEEIQTISVGDRSLWQIIPAANRMFIRPMEENASTNMTVITNKRSYHFDLKSLEATENNEKIVYVAKFIYTPRPAAEAHHPAMDAMEKPITETPPPVATPEKTKLDILPSKSVPSEVKTEVKPEPAAVPEDKLGHVAPANSPSVKALRVPANTPRAVSVSDNVEPKRRHYHYSFSGPDDLAPLQVFDDGQSTYFAYRDISQPRPNVYKVEASGKEIFISSYIKDDMLVVDAVVGELTLKNSNGTVHVYNELLNPEN